MADPAHRARFQLVARNAAVPGLLDDTNKARDAESLEKIANDVLAVLDPQLCPWRGEDAGGVLAHAAAA